MGTHSQKTKKLKMMGFSSSGSWKGDPFLSFFFVRFLGKVGFVGETINPSESVAKMAKESRRARTAANDCSLDFSTFMASCAYFIDQQCLKMKTPPKVSIEPSPTCRKMMELRGVQKNILKHAKVQISPFRVSSCFQRKKRLRCSAGNQSRHWETVNFGVDT